MDKLFLFAIIFLSITIIISLYRAIVGPSLGDRLISINVIGTKTIIIIAIVALLLKETYFFDVVLVYALINFVASIIISREIGDRGLED